MIDLFKYSGAGNDFIVLDGRTENVDKYRDPQTISRLCNRASGYVAADGRVGADGLMILTLSQTNDFRMEYYNSDGSGGMMCGNGGRCIVAFADQIGVKAAAKDGVYVFEAADGLHTGEVLERDGNDKIVRIKMIDVNGIEPVLDGYFLNTGTRHYVQYVPDVECIDIDTVGKRIRWDETFAPEGANVNFVDDNRKVRTFEKGVEAETLACGTGLTACAIALHHMGLAPSSADAESGRIRFLLHARRDDLSVDFIPCQSPFEAKSVYLTGPATWIK